VSRRAALTLVLALAAALVPAAAAAGAAADQDLVAQGRSLFLEGCASCHGEDAGGTNRAPDLHGVGARSADFYLSTGRMPLAVPGEEPLRNPPFYSRQEIDSLVAYVGSLGGPPIPEVDPEAGDLSRGERAFTIFCAGCHGKLAVGGVVTGAIAPPLHSATPTQIAEAVRVGPYVMPAFDERVIDEPTLNSIVSYVEMTTRHPDNRGGWALGSLGPITEGMVAFFIGLASLLIVARLIGERGT
jgi:ubiquinol-cytochrome c reductase cytochrome c subunit